MTRETPQPLRHLDPEPDDGVERNAHGCVNLNACAKTPATGIGLEVGTEFHDYESPPAAVVTLAAEYGDGGASYTLRVEQARALAYLLLDAANDAAKNTGAVR